MASFATSQAPHVNAFQVMMSAQAQFTYQVHPDHVCICNRKDELFNTVTDWLKKGGLSWKPSEVANSTATTVQPRSPELVGTGQKCSDNEGSDKRGSDINDRLCHSNGRLCHSNGHIGRSPIPANKRT